MLSPRLLLRATQSLSPRICLLCEARTRLPRFAQQPYSATSNESGKKQKVESKCDANSVSEASKYDTEKAAPAGSEKKRQRTRRKSRAKVSARAPRPKAAPRSQREGGEEQPETKSLKEALLDEQRPENNAKPKTKKKKRTRRSDASKENLHIEVLTAKEVEFQAVDVPIPPIPMLSYGLDRVLFNPGVYRLQDPRSRVYNFDPYLEKIMAVSEFDFEALSEYKTSSKDEGLLAITRRLGTKFTGSTSSMSGVLQHFHFLLSDFRELNHDMLSRSFPEPNSKFSKITLGPSAIFLRWKDGLYAVDADKSYDKPNIMSWLGHSLEKLLTTERAEFERYRRSNPEKAPGEDKSARCYHYSRLGNFLMRSQLDAHDPRLPGSGVFDLKTRAVVSIRMDHKEYEHGSGYQLRYDRGEWESFEREFYDMTRATMLKYSLQVRMGRMDGIFVAYHNIERIFGFQYLSVSDLDNVLHGQTDTCLGDQEFRFSIRLLDELIERATQHFPEMTLRLHFEARGGTTPFMYVFAEPVTEAQADEIQNSNLAEHRAFERDIVGVNRDDPEIQKEWRDIQDRVDEEVDEDEQEGSEHNEESNDTHDDGHAAGSTADGDASAEALGSVSKGPLVEDGPLMGWTLAVRNMVNGQYVDRPKLLTPEDDWTIEYHIKEIEPAARHSLYAKIKARRSALVGEDKDAEREKQRVDYYREKIRKYSERGRRWRVQQDEIDQRIGQHVFRPLGPGSEGAMAVEGIEAGKA